MFIITNLIKVRSSDNKGVSVSQGAPKILLYCPLPIKTSDYMFSLDVIAEISLYFCHSMLLVKIVIQIYEKMCIRVLKNCCIRQ
uniref:Uncharacterized protein n=1 Tax=Arundo donax TaxID=35708 RepID=A0A0A9EJL0_ARUDO